MERDLKALSLVICSLCIFSCWPLHALHKVTCTATCRSCNPLDIQQLTFPGDLWFVLVNPVFEAPTAEMRAVLPKQVPMSSAVHNCAMGGSLVRPLH